MTLVFEPEVAQRVKLRLWQVELLKLQRHLESHRMRMIVLFEGRDAAGKGGTIRRATRYMNEKHYRVVALGRPTEEQRSQWYFQRYVAQFPAGGEIVLFDRSWYNRAMVEPVFGLCTHEEYHNFMTGVTGFENVTGSAYHDSLTGDGGDNLIVGTGGGDDMFGLEGADQFTGTAGPDTITGGDGNDRGNGAAGDDHMSGDAGMDRMTGGAGADMVEGGDDNDRLSVKDGVQGNDTADGGGGTDTCAADPGDTVTNCP